MKTAIQKFRFTTLLGFVSTYMFAQVPYHQGSSPEIQKIITDKLDVPSVAKNIILDMPSDTSMGNSTRYGVTRNINVPLIGQKNNVSNTWYVKVYSKNAKSINFTLSDINISPNAKIYIYNEQISVVMGPITLDNSTNPNKLLSTIIFPGNTVYIKIIDSDEKISSSFTLSKVTYGLSTNQSNSGARAAASSIDCIPDATCYYGWENEWEMNARVIINGYQGTGTFVNNETQDRRPFVLTAFHVVDTDDDDVLSASEISAFNSVVVQVDLRSVNCNGSVSNGFSFTGANFRSAWQDTDFCLFELYSTPSIERTVNYAGWDRSGNTPSKGTSLHHPSGTYLRYSTSTNGGIRQHPLHPKFWQVTNWETGIVAPGSSGCALYNEYHKVIGQLKGGATTCTFMDFADRYGKFSDSWYGGGTSSTQLKAWLSPNQDLSSTSHLLPLTMTGGSNVCYGSSSTVTMPYVLSGETAIWSTSGNLSIVGSANNSVTVTSTYSSGSGMGTVTATFGGVQTSKNVYYGTPDVYTITYDNNISASTYNYVDAYSSHNVYLDLTNAIAANITGTNWNPSPNIGYSWGQYFASYNFSLNPGDVLYFNPLSATNQCGTANRTLAFASSSSYFVYPNPATTTMAVQFSSTKYAETLPDELNLISEASNKIVMAVLVKDVFNKKAFAEGNKVIFDVTDLPKGRYYLQVKDEKLKKQSDPIRIIITD